MVQCEVCYGEGYTERQVPIRQYKDGEWDFYTLRSGCTACHRGKTWTERQLRIDAKYGIPPEGLSHE